MKNMSSERRLKTVNLGPMELDPMRNVATPDAEDGQLSPWKYQGCYSLHGELVAVFAAEFSS